MSYVVCGSDLVLLWLWSRPAVTAPIRILAWELLYAAGASLALKRKKKKKNVVICICMTGSLCSTEEFAQQCKSTIL